MTTLFGISGSLRKESTNTKLLRLAAAEFDPDEFIEGDITLPLYNGDIENGPGIPDSVQKLADQIAAADAIIISTPEYNKAPSGSLKNALDWVSRTEGNPWKNKPLAIMSAAAGRAGGERTQFALRLMMMPFRPLILQGPEVLIADARNAFDEDGNLKNERSRTTLAELMDELRKRL